MREGMSDLCQLHSRTGIDKSGEYLAPDIDRQVGFGLLGLANFLANNNITYAEFGKALEAPHDAQPYDGYAGLAARELFLGVQEAANVAREHNMVRAFAMAQQPVVHIEVEISMATQQLLRSHHL